MAFKFSAQALDAKTLEVRYQIAKGYYMYRDKFKFAVEPASVHLGEAQFPQGDVHNDEFFGKVETYRKDVRIRLPLGARCRRGPGSSCRSPRKAAPTSGVCYIPQVQTAEIAIARFACRAACGRPIGAAAASGSVGRDRRRSALRAACSHRAACG